MYAHMSWLVADGLRPPRPRRRLAFVSLGYIPTCSSANPRTNTHPSSLTHPGKGSPRGAHNEGLVYVTRLHCTHYCSALTKEEHDEWMGWMLTATKMVLGTEGAMAGEGGDPEDGGIVITREPLHGKVLEPPKAVESEVRVHESSWE